MSKIPGKWIISSGVWFHCTVWGLVPTSIYCAFSVAFFKIQVSFRFDVAKTQNGSFSVHSTKTTTSPDSGTKIQILLLVTSSETALQSHHVRRLSLHRFGRFPSGCLLSKSLSVVHTSSVVALCRCCVVQSSIFNQKYVICWCWRFRRMATAHWTKVWSLCGVSWILSIFSCTTLLVFTALLIYILEGTSLLLVMKESVYSSRDRDRGSGNFGNFGTINRPSNSTTNRRRDDSSSRHSRSPPPSSVDKDLINPPSCCISPMSPSEWVLGPDHQSERAYGGIGDNSNSNINHGGNSDFIIGSARLPCSDSSSRGINFRDNLHVIPILPMMDDSVDETWDFDFDEGRGGTSVNTSRSKQPRHSSLFPDLSPRSEQQQKRQASLFSPVSRQNTDRDRDREETGSNSPLRGTARRELTRSDSNKDVTKSLQNREAVPRIQSARVPTLRTGRGRADTGTESDVRGEEIRVDSDSWAFKMIRHHSEPSLRPKCRQSTRTFYDQQTHHVSDNTQQRQHGKNAVSGPSHLSSHIKHSRSLSSRQKARTGKVNQSESGVVLARINHGRKEL